MNMSIQNVISSIDTRRLFSLFFGLLLVLQTPEWAQADESAERDFTLKVLPILKAKCFGCHGDDPNDVKAEYDMLSLESLLQGGESEEPAVVPGKPDESPLFLAITWEVLEMPPKENDRLTEDQIELVRQWILAGTPWPDEEQQRKHRQAEWSVASNDEGVIVETSGGLSDDWTYRRYQPEDLWAFNPLTQPDIPAPEGDWTDAASHPIDAFVAARLSTAGVAPAPQADSMTLLRRATYDLCGLPPTLEETAEFQAAWDANPDQAWSELIDRLLSRLEYGERWGQHWLDVARYADTGGYSNDYERSNAWRYRDYVIRSMNQDKPYNQFVIEQLAGDELADASVRQRLGGGDKTVEKTRLSGKYSDQESEWLVATGFLRMGPWDNAMVMSPEARQIYLDDVVNSVGQTFLSTTMRCLKCHDHKFDPIPTRDYYRMYAAFAGTQMAERNVPILESENTHGFSEGKKFVETMLKYAVDEKNRIVNKRETAARAWFEERGLEYVSNEARKSLPDEEKPPRHVGLDHVDEGQLKVREQDEWIWKRRLERYQPMAQSVYNGQDVNYSGTAARSLRIRDGKNPDWKPASVIFLGGSLAAPGESVGPGVLSACGIGVEGAPGDEPWLVSDEVEGRRLALAKWITHPQNPLATRSIVNRVWQHHFVKGIAGNPNNFGAKGAKPTHPQLLDWLATRFVQEGWKLKDLHRLIMTSKTYRMSGHHPEMDSLKTTDPDNRLLAYYPPRRLSAEELRDSLLALTGELSSVRGGLPAMPEINMEVALQPRMIQFSLAPAYQPSPTPELRNRRTIYAYRVRGQADPFLELFNQPNPNDSCEIRDSAAVTPQVFTLLNSDVINDRSIAFAIRVQQESDVLSEQVDLAFRLALGRSPNANELKRMVSYVQEMQEYHARVTPDRPNYPKRITRSLVEEFSGKVFEYEEILPTFEAYQPDIKPVDASSDTRALADLCLLLFNSSEFIYVY